METIHAFFQDGRLITEKPLNLSRRTDLLFKLDAALTDAKSISSESLKEDVYRIYRKI